MLYALKDPWQFLMEYFSSSLPSALCPLPSRVCVLKREKVDNNTKTSPHAVLIRCIHMFDPWLHISNNCGKDQSFGFHQGPVQQKESDNDLLPTQCIRSCLPSVKLLCSLSLSLSWLFCGSVCVNTKKVLIRSMKVRWSLSNLYFLPPHSISSDSFARELAEGGL